MKKTKDLFEITQNLIETFEEVKVAVQKKRRTISRGTDAWSPRDRRVP